MPKIGQDEMQSMNVANSNFQFSAIRPENLESTEYTLVTIAVDKSYSVSSFRNDLIRTLQASVKSCESSPRAENLLIRTIFFNELLEEVHGFVPLENVPLTDYDKLQPDGATALFDATYEGIGSILKYAEELQNQDMDVNGLVVVITDGDDNSSTSTPSMIAKQVEDALMQETVIESVMSILVGVNAQRYAAKLQRFKDEANLQQFVDAGDATPETLARLAKFITDSISSQSQSLGTGGPSQSLNF